VSVPAPRQEAKFDMALWVDRSVKASVAALLPRGDEDWKGWAVALRAACLKNDKLGPAIANNPGAALLALIKCARLGMSPDPALQHFALIPYGNVVDGQAMYRGWMHVAMQTGKVEWMHADVIYRQEVPKGPLVDQVTQRVNHQPQELERDQWKDDDIVGAYCTVKVKGRERLETRVMSIGDIRKRRAKGANGPGWREWFKEMCIVKPTKALFSSGRIPLTKDQQEAAREDEEMVTVTPSSVTSAPLPAAPTPLPPPQKPVEQRMWDEANEEPFPSDDELKQRLLRVVDQIGLERELSPKAVDAMAAKLAGKACKAADLSVDDLQKLVDELREVRP